MNDFDVIIIGAGAGGMTAAIYAKRAGKNVAIIEKFFPGGQMLTIDKIANFPSYEQIDGYTLSSSMKEQCEKLNIQIFNEEVISCQLDSEEKIIKTHKNEYKCKSCIIATGARPKQLNIENEKNWIGKGLSYCATCDGAFFQDKVVAVVGISDVAKKDVEYLSNICNKIYFITSAKSNLEFKNVINVELCSVKEIFGDEVIEGVLLKHLDTERTEVLKVDGLFVILGKSPDVSIYGNCLELDKLGFIKVDEKMQTNIPGVFAIGDVKSGKLKQIVTACSDGAIAGTFA